MTADPRNALLAACPIAAQNAVSATLRTWNLAPLPANSECSVVVVGRVSVIPATSAVALRALVESDELRAPPAAEASHTIAPAAPLIASFTATTATTGIHLDWTTAWETDLEGFHLWRGTTSIFSDAVRLTGVLLPPNGVPSAYGYVDRPLQPDIYYYWLEPVGSWEKITVGPAPVDWDGGLRTFFPLILHVQTCEVACAPPPGRLWLPVIAQQTNSPEDVTTARTLQ